jgi:signal transduction histidine kinase
VAQTGVMAVAVLRWLRIAGLATWAIIGVTITLFLDFPRAAQPARAVAWLCAYGGFAALFWLETGAAFRQRSRWLRLGALVAQSLCALGIAGLSGRPVGFIFLTLVAAQLSALLGWAPAAGWVLGQSAAMGWIYGRIVPAWEANAYVGVYLGFQAFAYVVLRAAISAADAREELTLANAELRATQALLSDSGRLAERERIARDLHDVLGHHLAAMSLNLEAAGHLADGQTREHVRAAQELARGLLGDVREVVTELRRNGTVDLGRALAELGQGVARPALHLELPADRAALPPATAEILLHCAEEAVTNAYRHSGARNLWIELRRAGDGVTLLVRDDGTGAAGLRRGHGLRGMDERVRAAGGRLTVETAPGAGLSVAAWLPAPASGAT